MEFESRSEVDDVTYKSEVYKTPTVRMHIMNQLRNVVCADESLMVRVYIGSKSKGFLTQISVATVD